VARRIRLAILMLAGIIVVGTSGYIVLGWGFLDALYRPSSPSGPSGSRRCALSTSAWPDVCGP
jgi:hypothetical protein